MGNDVTLTILIAGGNTMKRNNKFSLFPLPILLAMILGVTAANAQEAESPEIKVTFIRQGVDFKYYNQFILKTLDVEHTRLIPPPWVENPDPKKWQLSDSNKDFLRSAYRQAMKLGLEESKEFTVVTTPVRGTLELEISLVSLAPYARQGEKVTTRGYGSLSFEAALRDARTGELLALYEGTQKVGEDYQENTDFNKASNLTQHFASWGRRVSARLAAAHEASK
jgi:hypothetical protein